MCKLTVPQGYASPLTVRETQQAVQQLRAGFVSRLAETLNLCWVPAPLFSDAQAGASLAKWMRCALGQYGYTQGEGVYAEGSTARREGELDNLHGAYVDRWGWERVISQSQRTPEELERAVGQVVDAICDTQEELLARFPQLGRRRLSRRVRFVTTQQLEDRYPSLTPQQREEQYLQEHPTAFIMQIGGALRSGSPHEGRAPDCDDWQLNGDLLFWNATLDCAFKVASVGIRVDRRALLRQLQGPQPQRKPDFQRMVLEERLPMTMGGGVAQSLLSMLLLRKAHIGEVQASLWDRETVSDCRRAGIALL